MKHRGYSDVYNFIEYTDLFLNCHLGFSERALISHVNILKHMKVVSQGNIRWIELKNKQEDTYHNPTMRSGSYALAGTWASYL